MMPWMKAMMQKNPSTIERSKPLMNENEEFTMTSLRNPINAPASPPRISTVLNSVLMNRYTPVSIIPLYGRYTITKW